MVRHTKKLRRVKKGGKNKNSRKKRGGGLMDKYGKKGSTPARASAPPIPTLIKPKYERLTFLHITKTAGTAIEKLGENHGIKWGKNDTNLRDITSDVAAEYQAFWHVPSIYFEKTGLNDLLKHSKLFTVVRDPFTRVISEFYCPWGGYKSKIYSIKELKEINNVIDFNRWINITLNKISNKIASGTPVTGHWTPQNYYLYDNRKNKIVNDENILHFENIGPEFDALMTRNGYSFSFSEIPKMNEAENKRFTVDDLSEENKELIRQIYAEDFRLFGY